MTIRKITAASVIRHVFPAVSADTPVRFVEGMLNREGYAVITDINPFQIVIPGSVLESEHILLGDCIRKLPQVAPDTDIKEVFSLMALHATDALLVYTGDDFRGVIVRNDVVKALYEMNIELQESVKCTVRELRNCKSQFLHLADSIPAVFFTLTGDLRISRWGKSASFLSGIEQNEAIGKHIAEIVTPGNELQRYEKLLKQVIATKERRRSVYRHNGEYYDLVFYPFGSGVTVIAWNMSRTVDMEHIRSRTDERVFRSICQDLHDTVGQYITALSLRCAEAELKLSRGAAIGYDEIRGMHELCRTANETLHELIESIATKTGTHLAEHCLMNSICTDIEKLHNVRIERDDNSIPLPDDNWRSHHVVCFLREALVNAARHSGVNVITLAAEKNTDTMRYRVSDRGKGFDTAAVGRGFGLRMMRFNAGEIAAEFDLQSGTGGTTVSLELSL